MTYNNTVNTINTDMYLITLQGKESIYEQIRDQITKFVKLGVLKPDDKLPSVRTLAMELGINPNTVQRAYNQLESEHIIYTINTMNINFNICSATIYERINLIDISYEIFHYFWKTTCA